MYLRSTFFILFFRLASLANASLGEKVRNFDPHKAKANFVSVYTHHKAAVSIKEFTDSSGNVFAVSWKGKTHPDIKELFGAHYDEFRRALKAAKETHRGHGPLKITFDNLHLELAGNMGKVQGRAWLINETPSGVSANDIR